MVNLTRLDSLMREKKWGIGELATYSGVKYDTVYSVAKGRRANTSSQTLKKIADALEVSTDYLLGESDEKKPPAVQLSEPVRKLARIATNLSEARQEELMRIASVLAALDQERQTKEMPHNFLSGIEAAVNVARKHGADVERELIDALLAEFPELKRLFDDLSSGEQKGMGEG